MRILISDDNPFAHHYIRMSIARVLTMMGHQAIMWDIHKKPVFDAFDEFEPDLFIGQTYNITKGLIECLQERPHVKVAMKAADWGPRTHPNEEDKTIGLVEPIDSSTIDLKKYPVLVASDQEIEMVRKLQEATGKPDLVYVHYNPKRVWMSHKHWKYKLGIKTHSLMNAADVLQYSNGKIKPEYECDFCFVGGRWGYKAQTLDRWLIPLLSRDQDYNVKIFGNQPWGVSQYCGFLPDDEVRHLFSSAKLGINLSEPHSQDLGYDIIERPFKLAIAKKSIVSDWVDDLVKLFPADEIQFAKKPEDFKVLIDNELSMSPKYRAERGRAAYDIVLDSHTYFHRVRDLLTALNMDSHAVKCMKTFQNVKEQLKL